MAADVRLMVEEIAKALVDAPEKVIVREVAGQGSTTFELEVDEPDLGRVIGKQGRTARSIRTLLAAVGTKQNRRYSLEILE